MSRRPPKLTVVDKPLDEDVVKRAIFQHDGNLTAAADEMRIEPQRLRAFVAGKPNLKASMLEVMEQGVDLAVAVLFEGLKDKMSFQNRFYAAKEFLKSEAGRRRGFGRDHGVAAEIEVKADRAGVLAIRWLEPGDQAKTIEGEVE